MVQRFKNRLKHYRKMLGWSLTDVAKRLEHKDISLLSKWEHGTSAPNLRNLLSLSIVYKTLVDQLYPEIRDQMIKRLTKRNRESNENNKR